MIIENRDECKMEIRKLGFTFKQFAEQADITYPNLIKALNGDFTAREVREAFRKFNIPFIAKQNRKGKAA